MWHTGRTNSRADSVLRFSAVAAFWPWKLRPLMLNTRMVQARSAPTCRLCANNPPALNAASLWITQGRGGDRPRTQMEGLKFKLCLGFSVTQAYSTQQPHITRCNAFKKGRRSAVTSYRLQQINNMLFSQDVQGMYWSSDKPKPLVKFRISKAADEKWWNWRTRVVSASDRAD